MGVMLSLLSWFLLIMAAGGGLNTNSATAEVTMPSNSAAVTAYWHTMLPNTLMPSAILELLAAPAGESTTNDVVKNNGNRGPSTKAEDQSGNRNWSWGSSTKAKDLSHNAGESTTNDVVKNNGNRGPSTKAEDQSGNRNWSWGSSTKAKDLSHNGESTTNDVVKNNGNRGPSTKAEDQSGNRNWSWGSSTKAKDLSHNAGVSHVGQDKHKHGTMSSMVFLEEALKPGSTIPCYIQPSATSGAPLLRRDVADSIPMSTGNFTDILAMFAPVSNDMAAATWSTLDDCEHPRAIKGETKACVTSVESMVEFAAFVLGVSTYNLRAFSSQDVPVEGVMTGRGYKVADATRVREAGNTMTCHGGRFPFAMFLCHAVNPTRVYSVTLEGEDVDVDGAVQRMEVLAVCHLNTSDFHPSKMPEHVKPGDAPLCHFISRDSILWAPASGHVAAY